MCCVYWLKTLKNLFEGVDCFDFRLAVRKVLTGQWALRSPGCDLGRGVYFTYYYIRTIVCTYYINHYYINNMIGAYYTNHSYNRHISHTYYISNCYNRHMAHTYCISNYYNRCEYYIDWYYYITYDADNNVNMYYVYDVYVTSNLYITYNVYDTSNVYITSNILLHGFLAARKRVDFF